MAQLKSLIVNGVSRFNNTTYSNIAYNDTTYSTNGFVKVGFDNTNVLLAGGGTRSLDWFSYAHDHPFLKIAGGTMTGAIGVSFASDASWDQRFGLNFGRDGATGHIGNDDNDLALYARKGIELYVGETDLPDRVYRSYGLKITNSNLLYSSQNGTDQRVWHEGNDGSGSGLDADLLDGQHGSYYAKSSWMASYLALSGGVMTGAITSSVGSSMIDKTKGINFGTASSYGAHLGYNNAGNFGIFSANKIIIVPGSNVNGGIQPTTHEGLELTTTEIKFNAYTVWHSGNDGHKSDDSGPNADMLDGKHATYFAPIDSPALTGTPTAPTASTGTNNTQIATTAFVTTAVSTAVGKRPTYTIKRLDSPTANSYVASYKLYSVLNNNETPIGDTINIPKDYLVRSGEVKTVTTANNPYAGAAVGDKYLDFVVNTSGDDDTPTHIYIPVKDLVDIYTGGAAINVSSNNKISAYLNSNKKNGLEITASGIGLNLASSSSAGAMSSSTYNKLWNEDFHDYLPLAGGVMTGAITSSFGTSIGDKTKGINFGTASSYGGHIGYVNSGAMGMYAKDKIVIVPGVNIDAQQNPTNSGLELTTTEIKFNNQEVWWKGNQGHESGLDADTLDTYHGNDFLLKTGGTITGDLTIQGNTTIGDSVDDKLIINSTGYVLGAGNYDGTNENDPHTFSMQKLLTRTLYKKEYESYTPLTGDSTTANATLYKNGGHLFFMQVHPQSTNFFEPWHVKYRLYVNKVSGSNNDYYKGYYDCYISQEGNTVAYAFFNEFYSTSYRPIYNHLLLSPDDSTKWRQRGYDSSTGLCSHPIWIGAGVYNADSPLDARYYKIEVYEVYNCKITFPDTIQHYNKVKTGDSTYDNGIYSSTYYDTVKEYDGYSQGLREFGDDDTTSSTQLTNTQLLTGAYGIKQYSLVMQDSNGSWQSFTASPGTGTSKPKNPSKFRLGSRIYYYYSNSNVAAGAYTATSTIYQNIAKINFAYSINAALTVKKPLYIVGTVNAAKYFNLADVWWTQDEPTTEDGKVYIKVCESVCSSTSGDLLSDGKPMWFKDGLFRPYPESKPKFEEGTAENTIKLIHGNETSDDFTVPFATNASLLDGHDWSYYSTAHEHPYLPLVGGVLTGGVTVPAGTSMIKKTMGINFGAANSYGGHLGYIQAGDLGIYTKRDIYLIPNSNVQGESGDNTKGLKLSSSNITFNSKKVWWEDNDGHKSDGSGPDADLLDGLHAYELLTDVTLYTGGNSTKIDVTVGGTTLTSSVIVPYATNASLLDGHDWSYYSTAHEHPYLPLAGGTMTGAITVSPSTGLSLINTTQGLNFGTTTYGAHIGYANGNIGIYAQKTAYIAAGCNVNSGTEGTGKFEVRPTELIFNNGKVWHEGNDGHTSGLNADLLDGEHISYFTPATWMNSYLKLSGGTMTGAIRRDYDSSSDVPVLNVQSNSQDIWLWRVKDKSTGTATATSAVYGFGAKYLGTGTGNNNSWAMYSDNGNGTQLKTLEIKQSGDIFAYTPIHWANATALPEDTSPKYFLTMDSFANGGKTKWTSATNLASAIGLGNYLPLSGGTITGDLTVNGNLTANGNTTIGNAASDTLTINAKTTTYNDIILRTDTSGADSPSLIFNRAGRSIDWKTYVSGGHFYLSSASDTSTWTTRVWVDYNNGNINGNLVGNASTATKLQTARTISLSGDMTGSGTFDGSANLSIVTTATHDHPYAGSSTPGGDANTVSVNASNENATRNMVFHNGNTLYSTDDVTCNPSTDELTAKILRAKANDMYVGSAAGAQCHMQYDNTMKCIKFMFD